MTTVVASLLTGVLVLTGVGVTQWFTDRREHRARAWERRADAYVALMRWRLNPPDEERVPNPHEFEKLVARWEEQAYPLIAEATVFAGRELRGFLTRDEFLFRSAHRLSLLKPAELAHLARTDLNIEAADAVSHRWSGRKSEPKR